MPMSSVVRLPLAVLACAALALLVAVPASAQQSIAHLDSESVLSQMPEYCSARGEVDQLAASYQAEVDALSREADGLTATFAARELLYTDAEREAAQAAIVAKQQEAQALRTSYFGPNGTLFTEQTNRLRPVQERLLEAIETVANEGNYDYVVDRAGTATLLFAKAQHDITQRVLEELGVNTLSTTAQRC